MCPRIVAGCNVRCLRVPTSVSPGHPTKWLLRIAFRRVDLVGENRLACRNKMMSLVSASWIVKFAPCCCCAWCVGVVAGMDVGRVHKPLGCRLPMSKGCCSCSMTTCWASNVAVHPASHSWPMDMREWDKSGRTCALMLIGAGSGRRPVWDDVMVSPLGMETLIWCLAVVR